MASEEGCTFAYTNSDGETIIVEDCKFGLELTNRVRQDYVEGLNATYFTNSDGDTIIHGHIMMVYWTAFELMKKRMLDFPTEMELKDLHLYHYMYSLYCVHQHYYIKYRLGRYMYLNYTELFYDNE